jgi:hypothetical protein
VVLAARVGEVGGDVDLVVAGDTMDDSYPLIYDPSEYEEALR